MCPSEVLQGCRGIFFTLSCVFTLLYRKYQSSHHSPPFYGHPKASVKGFEWRFARAPVWTRSDLEDQLLSGCFHLTLAASLDLQIAEESRTGRFAGDKWYTLALTTDVADINQEGSAGNVVCEGPVGLAAFAMVLAMFNTSMKLIAGCCGFKVFIPKQRGLS